MIHIQYVDCDNCDSIIIIVVMIISSSAICNADNSVHDVLGTLFICRYIIFAALQHFAFLENVSTSCFINKVTFNGIFLRYDFFID